MEQFEFSRTPSDAFEMLKASYQSDKNEERRLFDTTPDLVSLAFSHGAYVAGGFARIMISADNKSVDDLRDAIIEHRGLSGDIDLFFPNDEAINSFLGALKRDRNLRRAFNANVSPTGACINFQNSVSQLQVVKRYTGDIIDVLSSFDIYNGMVAFNDKEKIVPSGWDELDDAKLLHVANWGSDFTIARIVKWQMRHHLRGLTPKTSQELCENAFKVIEKLKKAPVELPWGPYTHHSVMSRMKELLTFLSDQDLLLVSTLPLKDAYNRNVALKMLASRGGVELL